MTLKKFDEIWAANGDTDTPTDEKIDEGWVGGDRPSIEYFNWILNRLDRQVSDLASERVVPYHTEGTSAVSDYESAIATGLWTDPWSLPSDSANQISGGSTKEYVDVCSYIDSNGYPKLLVADNSLTKIEVWDPRTKTLVDTSDDLSDDLPAGSFFIISICTDGTSVYATLANLSASPDEHYIQAWDISTWDVKTGWPSTGTKFSGSGNVGSASYSRITKVIIANSSYLAVACCYQTISATTTKAIVIVDIADGTIDSEGAGDAPTGVSAYAQSALCSDGTNIYFLARESTPHVHVCSATIADATSGCGGSNYPLQVNDKSWGDIISIGSKVVSCYTDLSSQLEADVVMRTHDSSDADLDVIVRGISASTTSNYGDDYIFDDVIKMTFDGINIWILCIINLSGGTYDHAGLLRVDASRLSFLDTSETRMIDQVAEGPFLFMADTDYYYVTSSSALTFDGRDLWSNVDSRSSQTNSGKLARLPIALLRS